VQKRHSQADPRTVIEEEEEEEEEEMNL